MDRYIHDQNLALYRKVLAETTDPTKRQAVAKLLAGQRPRTDRGEASDQPQSEDVMMTSYGSTLLACGGIFALSFVAIWAFWFVERLRGASAPHL